MPPVPNKRLIGFDGLRLDSCPPIPPDWSECDQLLPMQAGKYAPSIINQ